MTTNIQTHAQTHERNAMKAQPKWQDWSLLVVAGILFISPWLFGTANQTSSSRNAWIVALGFVAFALRTTFFLPPGGYANKCAHEGGRIAWWQMILDTCKLSRIAKEELVVGAWLLVAPLDSGLRSGWSSSLDSVDYWYCDCGLGSVEAEGVAR